MRPSCDHGHCTYNTEPAHLSVGYDHLDALYGMPNERTLLDRLLKALLARTNVLRWNRVSNDTIFKDEVVLEFFEQRKHTRGNEC